MPKDTFALRDFNNGDQRHLKGDDLKDLPANQLDDFRSVGLVGAKPEEDKPAAPAASPKGA